MSGGNEDIIENDITWMEASMRSRGFWMHSSQRFSLEPVLEVAVELASSVADGAKVETAPSGPGRRKYRWLKKIIQLYPRTLWLILSGF